MGFFNLFFSPPFLFVAECLSNKSVQTVQMIDCDACHQEISSASKTCPHCGHPNPLHKNNRISVYEWFVMGLIAVVIIFISIIPPTVTNGGIPSCNTSTTQDLAKRTFTQIPIMHNLGIFVIDLKNVQEIGASSTERSCKATARLSNDTEHTIL